MILAGVLVVVVVVVAVCLRDEKGGGMCGVEKAQWVGSVVWEGWTRRQQKRIGACMRVFELNNCCCS